MDETATVVAYQEFDPYGNPVAGESDPYGYTGEWWEKAVGLLHLRARWYLPETGTFLSVDPVESEPPYQYVRGNPINYRDPAGLKPPPCTGDPTEICVTQPVGPETTEVNLPPLPPPPPPPPKPPKRHPTIGPATPPNPCKPYDEWIAVTPKRKPGQVALNLNHSTGSNVDLALVEGSVEKECSYNLLTGDYSCQGNVGAAGGPGAIKVGYEGSITEDGYEQSVLVKGDIGIAEVEGSLGSGGIGVGGSINTPTQQVQLELQALPPSTPHFPFPHFIGINLTDAANHNGIHNWVRMTAGVEVDGLEAEAPNIGELYTKLRLSNGICFGLDLYYTSNSTVRHYPVYPTGQFARRCNFK